MRPVRTAVVPDDQDTLIVALSERIHNEVKPHRHGASVGPGAHVSNDNVEGPLVVEVLSLEVCVQVLSFLLGSDGQNNLINIEHPVVLVR